MTAPPSPLFSLLSSVFFSSMHLPLLADMVLPKAFESSGPAKIMGLCFTDKYSSCNLNPLVWLILHIFSDSCIKYLESTFHTGMPWFNTATSQNGYLSTWFYRFHLCHRFSTITAEWCYHVWYWELRQGACNDINNVYNVVQQRALLWKEHILSVHIIPPPSSLTCIAI